MLATVCEMHCILWEQICELPSEKCWSDELQESIHAIGWRYTGDVQPKRKPCSNSYLCGIKMQINKKKRIFVTIGHNKNPIVNFLFIFNLVPHITFEIWYLTRLNLYHFNVSQGRFWLQKNKIESHLY